MVTAGCSLICSAVEYPRQSILLGRKCAGKGTLISALGLAGASVLRHYEKKEGTMYRAPTAYGRGAR